MRKRAIMKFRPGFERFEPKQLPSSGGLALHAVVSKTQPTATSTQNQSTNPNLAGGFQLERITQPSNGNSELIPPFQQVRVQSLQPVPGRIYNILSVSVRNSTARTFSANDGFEVKVTGQKQSFPVLTGDQTWKPGQVLVFYILSKQYYPIRPIVGAGFEFNLGGSTGTAIPGPSGIFQRVKYNPATIAKVINFIIPFGPGAKGHRLGLPDTAIWEFLSAKANVQTV
jgi:hypothetical protein